MADEVVITGMGIVSPLGHDMDANLSAARSGAIGIGPFAPGWANSALPVACAAQVIGSDWEPDLGERGREMDRGTRLGIAAMEQALRQAELPLNGLDGVAIVAGSAGPSSGLYCELAPLIDDEGWEARARGSHAPYLCGHALAGLAGLRFGATGQNLAVSSACASGSLAVAVADDLIRLGRADVVVAGAADSFLTALILGSFAKAGAVSIATEPNDACRPFDARRTGLVFAEGAAFFIVESAASASARGATVLARIVGSASANDGHAMWAPKPDQWAATIAEALRRSDVGPDAVSLVSAHAPGTVFGDAAEAWAIAAALGRSAKDVPVMSTKGMHGHAMGASPAIELALSIAALRAGHALPTVGCEEQDPEIDLRITDGASPIDGTLILKNAFGFMGTHTVLTIRVERHE